MVFTINKHLLRVKCGSLITVILSLHISEFLYR